MQRLSRLGIPNDRSLALIGNTHRLDISDIITLVFKTLRRFLNTLLYGRDDFFCILFVPPKCSRVSQKTGQFLKVLFEFHTNPDSGYFCANSI